MGKLGNEYIFEAYTCGAVRIIDGKILEVQKIGLNR